MLFVSNLLTRKTLPAELHATMLAKFRERHPRPPAADAGGAADAGDGAGGGGTDRIDGEGGGGGGGGSGGNEEDQKGDSVGSAAMVGGGGSGSAADDDGAGADSSGSGDNDGSGGDEGGGEGGSEGGGDGGGEDGGEGGSEGGSEGGGGLDDIRSKLLAERRKLLDAKAARAGASGGVIDGTAGDSKSVGVGVGEGEDEGGTWVVDLADGAMVAEGSLEWTAAVVEHTSDGGGLGEGPLKLSRARSSFNSLDEVVETVEGLDEYPVVADALGYTHELISGILQYHPLLREDEDTLVATMTAVDRVVFGELGPCHTLLATTLTTRLATTLTITLAVAFTAHAPAPSNHRSAPTSLRPPIHPRITIRQASSMTLYSRRCERRTASVTRCLTRSSGTSTLCVTHSTRCHVLRPRTAGSSPTPAPAPAPTPTPTPTQTRVAVVAMAAMAAMAARVVTWVWVRWRGMTTKKLPYRLESTVVRSWRCGACMPPTPHLIKSVA